MAAQIIFLWLHHAWLARQTSQRQQREAALTCLQHEQEYCACVLVEEQRKQAAAAQAKAIADEADERHPQAEAAIGEQRQQAATAWEKALAQAADKQLCQEAAAASAELALVEERHCHKALMQAALSAASSLADEQCRHEADKQAAALTELALAEDRRRHESATQTAMSAESSLANKRSHHEAAARAVELAELVLAKKQHHHKTTAREKALANNACERCCQESAKCTAALAKSTLAAEQTAVSADSALPEPALAEDKQHQEETAKKQRRSDNEHVMAPVLPPDTVIAAIWCIWVECTLLAAPLEAILVKIECNDIAHEAQASLTTTLPHPAAMLSTPPRPMTYVGAVLSTMGGSTCVTSLALAPLAIPSPIVNGQLQTIHRRARPCCRTGHHHRLGAPSPPDKVLPSHPHPTKEGLSMPTNPPNLLARATTCSGTPSPAPPSTASSTPSLLPFIFGSKVCLSSEGVVAHPFCVGNPPPQKRTQCKHQPCHARQRHAPLGSQSTGAPSSWAASSALCS